MSAFPRERLSIFTDPAAYADEDAWHGQAARLRGEEGVTRIRDAGFAPFWAVLRHRDVSAVERDSATFRNAPYPILVDGQDREGGPPVRNLVGGGGPHFCLGAYLARLELRAFFERFIPRVRSLEIDGDVVRAKTTFVATFKNLPVRMELAG